MAVSIDAGHGTYPVLLSDALLGKGTKDVYTGMSYDKKPNAGSSMGAARIKPAGRNFDLSFDNDDEHGYHGTRQIDDSQYVLVFDPTRKAYILHQVDSTFQMNRAAGRPKPVRRKSTQPPSDAKATAPQKVAEKPKKKPARDVTPEAEDEDSDDGLEVVFPDSQPPPQYRSRPMPSLLHRAPSEAESVEGESEYEDDAGGEPDVDVDPFKLPSPLNNGPPSVDDMELDLEAELEQALETQQRTVEDESSESEEE